MIKYIFGCGTGRCGTVSFSKFLNNQAGCISTHEQFPILDISSWGNTKPNLAKIESFDADVKSDVALWWIYFVDELIERYGEEVKFVCLERDKESMVKSYMKKTNRHTNISKTTPTEHWRDVEGSTDTWDVCYPNFDVETKLESVECYWEKYHELSEHYTQKYPDQFKKISMLDLNDEQKMNEVGEWLGFESVVFKKFHTNKG